MFVEELLTKAQKGECFLYAPKLLLLEMANGLRYAVKQSDIAEKAYNIFLNLPIQTLELSQSHYQAILKLAYEKRVSAYDTAYYVLALSRDCYFLTCDKAFAKSIHDEKHIMLLG